MWRNYWFLHNHNVKQNCEPSIYLHFATLKSLKYVFFAKLWRFSWSYEKSRFSNWPNSKGDNSETIHHIKISYATLNVQSMLFMTTYNTQLWYLPFWGRRFLKTSTVKTENFTKLSVFSKWRKIYHGGRLPVCVRFKKDGVIYIHL